MKLLPYDKFCIITSLKPAEVEEQLQLEVIPDPGLGFNAMFADMRNKYFKGIAENGRFKFTRILKNRNSFLPVVIGHTESWLNGSRVYVKMRLHLFAAAFMCIWLPILIIIGISILMSVDANHPFSLVMLLPFGVVGILYITAMFSYSYECNKLKTILLQILDGQIDDTAIYVEKKS